MHFRLDDTAPMITAPLFPDGASKTFDRPERFIASSRARAIFLPWPSVTADRNNCMSIARSYWGMALPGVVRAVPTDAADGLIRWDGLALHSAYHRRGFLGKTNQRYGSAGVELGHHSLGWCDGDRCPSCLKSRRRRSDLPFLPRPVHGPPEAMARFAEGQVRGREEYSLVIAAKFKCGDARYSWLNSVISVANGEQTQARSIYTFFEIG